MPPVAWIPYCGSAPLPGEWLERWNLDPLLLAALAGLAVAWRVGVPSPTRGQALAFGAAMAMLGLLFVSPLCALTSALFAARVAHHALLVTVAAPLLVWSLPAAGRRWARGIAGWTMLHTAVVWAWHVPALYDAALGSDLVYWLMQATLLASAVGFWASVRQSGVAAAIAALLATMVQMGLLGALLTFAGRPFYAPHFLTTQAWGFSPLEDQQLAGLVMWAPAAGLYLAAAMVVAGRWLQAEERAAA